MRKQMRRLVMPHLNESLTSVLHEMMSRPGDGLRVCPDGTKEWFINGEKHRDDGPAVEWPNGAREWWRRGLRHRDDGPAIEKPDGYKAWYRDGVRHRENGPAVEYADGGTAWWHSGLLLRQAGPTPGRRHPPPALRNDTNARGI
jgi:hypothetical protein